MGALLNINEHKIPLKIKNELEKAFIVILDTILLRRIEHVEKLHVLKICIDTPENFLLHLTEDRQFVSIQM